MTQNLHKSTVELKAEQEQERQRQKVLEQKQQKEHKEWKEREQVLKDELAKRQSKLENNTVHRDNMSDYAHYQPHRRNYYHNNDRRRNQYENNNQGNRRQRVPYNGEQSAREMGYPDHGQNNSREYFNPRGRQPYHQRNRDGNFGDINQRHHRRVNNRGQHLLIGIDMFQSKNQSYPSMMEVFHRGYMRSSYCIWLEDTSGMMTQS